MADEKSDHCDGVSSPKRMKESCILEKYINTLKAKGILQDVVLSIKRLFEDQNQALGVLQIESSNASVGYGVPFPRAWCHTKLNEDEVYSMALFFKTGRNLLHNLFIKDPNYEPDEEHLTEALTKLLSFLCDEDSKNFISKLEKMEDLLSNKTRLSVALAEHLLKKLAPNSDYILNHHYKRIADDSYCKCGCSALVHDKYSNTSIGHHSVWHGNIDIVAGKEDLPVVIEAYEDQDSAVEVNYYKSEVLLTERSKHQILAQTIVFSFLQKKRHPDAKHFMIPCVGMTMKQIVFYFYDSENDVLLQSKMLPLSYGGRMDYTTVIALWLVLNYKQLGSGLPGYLSEIPKSQFVHHVKDELDMYSDRLSFGNVCGAQLPESFNPTSNPKTKFVFPPDFEDFAF